MCLATTKTDLALGPQVRLKEGGREGGRERGRKGEREGEREGGRKGGKTVNDQDGERI
jgi:hypothetical protein